MASISFQASPQRWLRSVCVGRLDVGRTVPSASVWPSTPTTAPAPLPALTGVRGALALWIMAVHILVGMQVAHVPFDTWLPAWVVNTVWGAAWAVDGFFMLSGFVLAHVYSARLGPGFSVGGSIAFMGHRIARVYPVHLVILLAYLLVKLNGIHLVVETCGHPLQPVACDRFSSAALLKHLLMVSSWGWNPTTSWNVVAWSISSEWFVYLCFPALILLTSRIRRVRYAVPLALLALTAVLLILKSSGLGPSFGESDEYGLVRVSGSFVCGNLLYRIYLSPRYRALPWAWLGTIAVLGVIVASNSPWTWLPLFFLALLVLSLAQPRGPISKILSTKPAMWLGNISYSLYMCHLFVLEMLGVAFKDPSATPLSQQSGWQILGVTTFLFVAPIAFAALLHYGVDEPSRKWLRRRFDGFTLKALATPKR